MEPPWSSKPGRFFYGTDKTVFYSLSIINFAGVASFKSLENGLATIPIALNEGWSLQDGGNIKIQGYDVATSGNPSPGRFTT
jgi:hypothetical protein